MIRFGIVGAENSHCAAIAKLCNVQKRLHARVVCVWGEAPRYAKAAAEAGAIPCIVRDWREMAGHVDGVMIDHRHAAPHAEVARFFLERRIPTFVDKPFTYRLREARALCALARRKRTPLTSFSVIPQEKNFQQFKRACGRLGTLANVMTTGPVDIRSRYGGIFFYGVHQVDAIVELLGTDAERVSVIPHGGGGVAVLTYRNGPTVTMNLVDNGNGTFHWSAVGERDVLDWRHQRDEVGYLAGARLFVNMFKTGKQPFSHERMMAPVAILEAMERSIKLKRPVRVARVGKP